MSEVIRIRVRIQESSKRFYHIARYAIFYNSANISGKTAGIFVIFFHRCISSHKDGNLVSFLTVDFCLKWSRIDEVTTRNTTAHFFGPVCTY